MTLRDTTENEVGCLPPTFPGLRRHHNNEEISLCQAEKILKLSSTGR